MTFNDFSGEQSRQKSVYRAKWEVRTQNHRRQLLFHHICCWPKKERKDGLPLDSFVTLGSVHGSFFPKSGADGLVHREKERYFEDESLEKDAAIPINGARSWWRWKGWDQRLWWTVSLETLSLGALESWPFISCHVSIPDNFLALKSVLSEINNNDTCFLLKNVSMVYLSLSYVNLHVSFKVGFL